MPTVSNFFKAAVGRDRRQTWHPQILFINISNFFKLRIRDREGHREPNMASSGLPMKPHAVCLPFPIQSHIGAMLKLAKLLHHRGLCITFVNTEFNHRRLLDARGPGFLDDLPPGFRFAVIPDGLPPSQANATQDLAALCESAMSRMGAPFCTLVRDLNERAGSGSGFPPVSCILSDGTMAFSAHPAGEKFGIPVVNLFTISASDLMAFLHEPKLIEKGLAPVKEAIDRIPGMKNIRLADIPSFVGLLDPDGAIFKLTMELMTVFVKGFATIIHTFQALEADVMDAFSSTFTAPIYAIGPLHLLIDQIPDSNDRLKRIGCNLWKEDAECVRWLDSQEPGSVLYINFGSVASLTSQQLVEFATGIANSKHRFLWIIRPDLVKGDTAILPPEFNEDTRGRAFVTEWCPQEEVLSHPSIGGFLTHCGWNSVLESLSAGVPMLCWPCGVGDQAINSKYVCFEWEAGLEIERDVSRDGVERVVRELMEGEKGKHLKNKAMEWKKLAMEAAQPLGSSSVNLDKLLHDVLSR